MTAAAMNSAPCAGTTRAWTTIVPCVATSRVVVTMMIVRRAATMTAPRAARRVRDGTVPRVATSAPLARIVRRAKIVLCGTSVPTVTIVRIATSAPLARIVRIAKIVR